MASLLERIASFPAQIIAELKKINEKLAELYTAYESTHKKDERQPVVLNATLSRPEAEETEDKRHHGAVESFQDRYLFIQIGGLFITMVIAVATLLSAKAAKDAAFASQEQAKAAWKNIEITSQNIQLTVDNFQRDQRAWVGIDTIDRSDLRPKSDFSITLRVVNRGHTPALSFESQTVLHSLAKDEKFKPIYGKSIGTDTAN